jgi:hypothetical protein
MASSDDGLLFLGGAWPAETFEFGWSLRDCAKTLPQLAAIVQACKEEITVVRFPTCGYRGYRCGRHGAVRSEHKDYPITLMNLRGLDSEQMSCMMQNRESRAPDEGLHVFCRNHYFEPNLQMARDLPPELEEEDISSVWNICFF